MQDVIRMNRYIAISVVLLLSCNALAIDLTEVRGKLSCPSIGNQQECALTFERKITESEAGFLVRENDQLKIRLESGLYKKLSDKHSLLNVIEVVNNFAIIREQFWEGNTWHILSLKNGKIKEVKGYPLSSPDGEYIICSQQDLEANYSPNIFDLYKVGNESLNKVFSSIPDDHGWGPGEVEWVNSDTVIFNKVQWNPDPNKISATNEYYIKAPHVLRNNDGKWSVTYNKASH